MDVLLIKENKMNCREEHWNNICKFIGETLKEELKSRRVRRKVHELENMNMMKKEEEWREMANNVEERIKPLNNQLQVCIQYTHAQTITSEKEVR